MLNSKALRNTSTLTESGESVIELYAYDTRNLGRHIRRLRIEPSSNLTLDFDRCNPETVMKILGHATGLQVFSDFRGIRRREEVEIRGVEAPSFISCSGVGEFEFKYGRGYGGGEVKR